VKRLPGIDRILGNGNAASRDGTADRKEGVIGT
jgi:hypothetical protein